MDYRKKLIEVALPLEAINAESAREKSIRHGHPSTLHLWWARRPLAACRAVLWASLVDDPSSWPDRFPTEEEQKQERQRLFDILARFETVTDKKGKTKRVVRGLVSWNDINDVDANGEVAVLVEAQREIARCLAWARDEEPPTESETVRAYIAEHAPPAYDPFAGGGSIPLEAQRLGLEAHASDLNPVAVLINKALIEIPPKFKDMPPVNPVAREKLDVGQWRGAQGLAEDVRYYGKWMRDEAFKRIGHLYPKVELPPALGSKQATVVSWLWTRTIKCPNPACGCAMPLARSFNLSTRKGKEFKVQPLITKKLPYPKIEYQVVSGKDTTSKTRKNRKGTICICCNTPVSFEHIRAEAQEGKLSHELMGIVADIGNGRTFVSPISEHSKVAQSAKAKWEPDEKVTTPSHDVDRLPMYGMYSWGQAFTNRQLVALTTLNDLIADVQLEIQTHSKHLVDPVIRENYSIALASYLGLAVSRSTNTLCSLAIWSQSRDQSVNVFSRQALAMNWDFPEVNPFANAAGDFEVTTKSIAKVIELLPASRQSGVSQKDAAREENLSDNFIFSTDPPYFDNVGYADLSDFFYVWLRRSLNNYYPDIFRTLLTPKNQELIAAPHRFNSNKKEAENFFEEGLRKAFGFMERNTNSQYPTTVYYAFKQAESESLAKENKSDIQNIASTGWETMLESLLGSGFSILGTWPMRTERPTGVKVATNVLASSIVLVCRPRPTNATKITRRQFLSELKRQLPKALKTLQQGNIAPVDLAQASIGPGMAIFSKYASVLESDGSPMRVRTALQLINQILDEFLTEQEGEFDADTRWALTWYEQYQFDQAPYGEAETLSKAKNTSVQGLVDAGILEATAGKVRLLPRTDLPEDWDPSKDDRLPDWEATQHLIHCLDTQGEVSAAKLLGQLGDQGESARDLAYRLYTLCDRKGWSKEGLAYNSLVIAWPEISRLATEYKLPDSFQTTLEV